MVVGGYGPLSDVEIIDLNGFISCQKPADLPMGLSGMTGTYIDNEVIVCGGYRSGSRNNCYKYDKLTGWTEISPMTSERSYAAAANIDDTHWLITGSYEIPDDFTSEIFDSERPAFQVSLYNYYKHSSVLQFLFTYQEFVGLPVSRSYHSLVFINKSSVFLLNDYFETNEVFSLSTLDGQWKVLPNTNISRIIGQAGRITFPDQTQAVVITGGERLDSTEVFSLDTQQWSNFARLPIDISYGASVQYEDSFLIVGGYSFNDGELDTIYRFNVIDNSWDLLPQRLGFPKYEIAAFLVPESYC